MLPRRIPHLGVRTRILCAHSVRKKRRSLQLLTFLVRNVVGEYRRRRTERLQWKRRIAGRIPRRRSPTSLVSIQQSKFVVDTIISGGGGRIRGWLLLLCGQISKHPVYRRHLEKEKTIFSSNRIIKATYNNARSGRRFPTAIIHLKKFSACFSGGPISAPPRQEDE